jgi:hypothetical protein
MVSETDGFAARHVIGESEGLSMMKITYTSSEGSHSMLRRVIPQLPEQGTHAHSEKYQAGPVDYTGHRNNAESGDGTLSRRRKA